MSPPCSFQTYSPCTITASPGATGTRRPILTLLSTSRVWVELPSRTMKRWCVPEGPVSSARTRATVPSAVTSSCERCSAKARSTAALSGADGAHAGATRSASSRKHLAVTVRRSRRVSRVLPLHGARGEAADVLVYEEGVDQSDRHRAEEQPRAERDEDRRVCEDHRPQRVREAELPHDLEEGQEEQRLRDEVCHEDRARDRRRSAEAQPREGIAGEDAAHKRDGGRDH